jgi:hypothetical protein
VITAASEDVCWDFGDKRNTANNVKADKTHASEPVQETEVGVLPERIYCNLVGPTADVLYENQRYKLLNAL